ncbi:hypothetical protein [Micromonospora humida]|uniref:hypothetical protein n=1 Tax=Micromonospora humida TaxID=2809018 RepID=UPI0033FB623E
MTVDTATATATARYLRNTALVPFTAGGLTGWGSVAAVAAEKPFGGVDRLPDTRREPVPADRHFPYTQQLRGQAARRVSRMQECFCT